MNVRFFAGTKEQYLGITKHNPIALYFCGDTRELFWGDKLLSDGVRVIPSIKDLPSLKTAADGVIYYAVNDRTGYVLAPDRTSWTQIIHAPAADINAVHASAANTTAVSVTAIRDIEKAIYEKIASIDTLNKVKEISFAGVALDRTDGAFSIERDAALKALGISFTEGTTESDIKTVATKEYVDSKIETIPDVDLDDYVQKSDLAGLATEGFVEEFVKKQILEAELNDKEADLSVFYTKAEVDALIPDTSKYVTKDEIPSLEDYVTKDELSETINGIEHPAVDLTGYATEQFVTDAIAAIEAPEITEITFHKVDFNAPDFAAAVKAYNAGKVLLLTNAAPDTNSYAMMNYVSDNYITFTKFLTNRSETYGVFNTYYLSADNTWEVSKEVKISKVEANVEGEIAGQLTTIKINKEIYSLPSIEGFATEDYVNEAIASIKLPEFPEVDLSDYATEDFVKEEIAKVSIPEVDNFATKEELADAIAAIEHPTQDLSEYVKKDELEGFIREIPSEYVTEAELDAKKYLTEHQSLEGYATEQFVTDVVDAIEIPEIPENVSAFTNDAGYLTEHQDLSDYAKRDELPSIDGLATEDYVAEAIGEIEFPETDLSEYSTTAEMNATIATAAAVKADDIPFTETKFVTKSTGEFKPGDDVKGLTVAQIFAKLLGLSDVIVEPEEPDDPEIPDEPKGIVDSIIFNELPMYSINENAELAEVPFVLYTLTEEEALAAPSVSGFYQIKDADGNVIESGYQEMQIESDEVYYVIALPKEIDFASMVSVQAYSTAFNKWMSDDTVLTNDAAAVAELCDEAGIDTSCIDPERYTVWAIDECPTGRKLRFVINE